MPLKHLAVALLLVLGWNLDYTVFSPGPPGTFDETAVKDPSIVFADGQWHLFYTARGNHKYSLGYAHAPSLEDLTKATHTPLPALVGAAPQVFFFRPQQTWYLIYQTTQSNYQPVYSTTKTIADPTSWSAPQPLVRKDDRAKWIDFWVICDASKAYLTYTRDHKDVVAMTTSLADFPHGFANPQTLFKGVHEAVHIYRQPGPSDKYAMLFELRGAHDSRTYQLAEAPALSGPWIRTAGDFATTAQAGTEVSHGELLRTGNDERLEADLTNARFLIQTMAAGQHKGDYPELPWHLALISRRPN